MAPAGASRNVRDGPSPARLPVEPASPPRSPQGSEAPNGRSRQELLPPHVAAEAAVQDNRQHSLSSPPRSTLEAPPALLPNVCTSGFAPVAQVDDPAGVASTDNGYMRFTTSPVDDGTAGRSNLPPDAFAEAVGEQYLPSAALQLVPSMPTVPLGEEVAAFVAGLVDGNLVSLEARTPADEGGAGWPHVRD